MNKADKLAALQAWFGQAISHPLPTKYAENPLVVSHPELAEEAQALIQSKGGPSGFDRLGVYNQQYWFRLVNIMQSEYPCGVHILGLHSFNQWVILYLEAHPPSSPYLAELDAKFLPFLQIHLTGENKQMVLEAIAFDRAYSKAFDAPTGLTLAHAGVEDPMQIMPKKLRLAPHITTLKLGWDFAAYRNLCRQDESLEADIELNVLDSQVIIYRNLALEVRIETMSTTAFAVLSEFESPILLPEVFTRLEGRLTDEEELELVEGLMLWFQDWVSAGWLCLAEELQA